MEIDPIHRLLGVYGSKNTRNISEIWECYYQFRASLIVVNLLLPIH